jgi:cell wall-associated protease
MKILKLACLSMALAFTGMVNAQGTTFQAKKGKLTEDQLKRWSHLDLGKDSIPGMSVDRVYAELLKGKTGKKVIVGVVDSGVDIEHEDLKSVVWTNTKEIAGNGIDDDKNGYIDDVHGWNFLGNSDKENLEMTRMMKKPDDGSLAYKEAKVEFEKKIDEYKKGKQQVDFLLDADKTLQQFLKKDNYTLEDVKAIVSDDPAVNRSKMVMSQVIPQAGPNFREEIGEYKEQVYDMLNYNLNVTISFTDPTKKALCTEPTWPESSPRNAAMAKAATVLPAT